MIINLVKESFGLGDVDRLLENTRILCEDLGIRVNRICTYAYFGEKPFRQSGIDHQPFLRPSQMPDGDVLLCASTRLAQKMAEMPARTGTKYLLVNDEYLEEFEGLVESWRLPMERIVTTRNLSRLLTMATGMKKLSYLEHVFDAVELAERDEMRLAHALLEHLRPDPGWLSTLFNFEPQDINTPVTLERYCRVARRMDDQGLEDEAAALYEGIVKFVDDADMDESSMYSDLYGESLEYLNRRGRPRGQKGRDLLWKMARTRFNPARMAGLARCEPEEVFANQARFDGFLRIYPTLSCNLKCPYCVNRHVPDTRTAYPHQDPGAWARAINSLVRPVVLTGGEPFLYPGLVELLNSVYPEIKIRVYSNFTLDLADKLEKINRPVEYYLSWHPGGGDRNVFLDNLKSMGPGYESKVSIHAIDAPETRHLLADDLEFFRENGLNVDVDVDQRGFAGSDGNRRAAICRKRIYLVAPDGTRYQCVSKLLRRVDPMENMLEGPLGPEVCLNRCTEYGICAPCDALGETAMALEKTP